MIGNYRDVIIAPIVTEKSSKIAEEGGIVFKVAKDANKTQIKQAIEKIYNFTGITHGMAVAIGMVLIARAGEKQGITEKGTADKIASLCRKYGLPVSDKASFEDMAQAAQGDKKTAGGSIDLVLLSKIGDSFTKNVALDSLCDFITT